MSTAPDLDPTSPGPGPDAGEGEPADLLEALDLAADEWQPGRFHTELSHDWDIVYVFGGVTMALAARAAERALGDPDQTLRSATATYCSPVAAGPITADTRVLRRGRMGSQVSVDLSTPASEGTALHLTATFGRGEQTELAFVDVAFPDDVLEPEQCEVPEQFRRGGPFGPLRFHQQTDWLPALAGMTDDDWQPGGPARSASWFSFRRPPLLDDGTIDPIALCVPGDVLGPAVARRFGSWREGQPAFLVLSLEIAMHWFAPAPAGPVLQHVQAQHAGDGYAFGTAEIWGVDRSLVAFASQRARLRVVPPGETMGAKP